MASVEMLQTLTTEVPSVISVIMPCFNARQFLETAVGSVLKQTYPAVELIVIDDGSTDDSRALLVELAAANPGRITLLQQKNCGPYPARNFALKHASGEYVAFLDADDFWDERCLEKLHAALAGSNADLAYCGWQNIGPGARSTEPYVPPAYESNDPIALFLKNCPWPIHAALISRRTIDAVGGFSERFFSSMDYDIWLRILAHTRNMVRVPEVLAFYRWHGAGQISSVKWRQVFDAWQVRRDFIHSQPQLCKHLGKRDLHELTDGVLLKAGYEAYWKRDLVSAQHLFRKAMKIGHWRPRDLKYLLPSFLPRAAYARLIQAMDRK